MVRSCPDRVAGERPAVRLFLQKSIHPLESALCRVGTMLRFVEAMAFAWIARKLRCDAAPPEGHVHFFRLGNGHIVILLAVNEQSWRGDVFHVSERRPLPQQRIAIVIPWKSAEIGLDQVLIKRGPIEADQV